MFRKSILAAAMIIMASQAFAVVNGERRGVEHEGKGAARPMERAGVGQVHDAVRLNDTANEQAANSANRDAGLLVQALKNDPSLVNNDAKALAGVDMFISNIANYRSQGKSVDEARQAAAKDMGTTEEEILAACGK